LNRWQGTFAASEFLANMGGAVYTNPGLLWGAQPPASTLAQLQQQYGFSFTGDYQSNWGGQHEKWLRAGQDGNHWYYLLPGGGLYRWQDSFAASTLVAQVGSTVWNDPALLHNAQKPAELPHVTLTVDTSGTTPVLKIIPDSN